MYVPENCGGALELGCVRKPKLLSKADPRESLFCHVAILELYYRSVLLLASNIVSCAAYVDPKEGQ